MLLKRKRSSPTISSPASDTTTSSTDPTGQVSFFFSHSKPKQVLFGKTNEPWQPCDDGSLWISRTRKRHRDNRPDEQMVFGRFDPSFPNVFSVADNLLCSPDSTIARLFDAQRQRPQAEPLTPRPLLDSITTQSTQKSTLHSFWRMPDREPMRNALIPTDARLPSPLAPGAAGECQDCNGFLSCGDGMDLDDETQESQTACASCRRCICDCCAVRGTARLCLGCAGRRWR